MTNKVNRALYALRFIETCLTQKLYKRLGTTLVIPHLGYCSVVYLNVLDELWTRLQRLTNSCDIYIYGVGKYERIIGVPFRVFMQSWHFLDFPLGPWAGYAQIQKGYILLQ